MKTLNRSVWGATMLVALLLGQMAFAAEPTFDFGGYVRIDLTGEAQSNGSDVIKFSPGNRALLNFTGRIENESGLFAEAYGEGRFAVDGEASSGDIYVEVGNPTFSFKVGNCGLDDAFHWGDDFYVAEIEGVTLYSADDFDGDARGILNFTVSEALKLQLAGYVQGDEADDVATNDFGIRPVVTLTAGTITAGAGAEYLMSTPQDSDLDGEVSLLGFGGYVSAELGTITVGGAAAMAKTDGKSFVDGSDIEEDTVLQARGFVNFSFGDNQTLGVAGGLAQEDVSENESVFGYAAYTVKPFMLDGLRLQLGASFASGTVADEDVTLSGAMARLRYDF